jgi:hypothetical protein
LFSETIDKKAEVVAEPTTETPVTVTASAPPETSVNIDQGKYFH